MSVVQIGKLFRDNSLLAKTAAVAIGLTDEKQRELQEAYRRESAVVRQERSRLYYEALDELLKTLSPEQQKRYNLLVGNRFDRWFE
jgi:predicted transcriptional regulator